jgi:hypothetical protein
MCIRDRAQNAVQEILINGAAGQCTPEYHR